MSTSGKPKPDRQPVLAANVSRIMAELHQLAATNACNPATGRRASSADAPAMVIRGK